MNRKVIIFFVILFLPLITQGDVVDDLNKQIQEQESKRIELEKKLKNMKQLLTKNKEKLKH